MSSRKPQQRVRAKRHRAIHQAIVETLEQRILLTGMTASPLGIGLGGTSYYPDMNPLNPNEIYLETDMGEVWHTTDSGLHWTTLNMQTQLHSNLQYDGVQFTSNTNIQYAISAQNTPMVTSDDGTTWTQLPGWAAIKATDGGAATHLIVDPTTSNRLVLLEQKLLSTNPNKYDWWTYYSTDGGNTFTLINSDTTGTSLDENWSAGGYWNGNNITFATFKGLYSSTNGGTSWTFTSSSALSKPNDASGFNVNSGETYSKIISFTGSTSGTTTRLYAIAWSGSDVTPAASTHDYTDYAGLYTSTDGGVTWTDVDGSTFGQPGTAYLTPRWVQMVNSDVNDVWIGGSDNTGTVGGTIDGSPIVYKSANAGTSWTRLLLTGADTTHFATETPNQNVYTHAWGVGGDFSWGYLGGTTGFVVDRSNANIINFSSMGSLFGTIDGGANWYDLESGGPNQLANSAWNPEGTSITKGTAYANSQANESSAWNLTFTGPNNIFVDDTDVTGQFTTNGGATWAYPQWTAHSLPNTFYDSQYVPSTGTLYVVASGKHDIFINNIDDSEIEAGGNNYVLASTDQGATWSLVHQFADTSPARTIAIDPNNPNVAYVGVDNSTAGTGGIWKTTDLQDGSNSVWVNLSTQPHRNINDNTSGTQSFADFYPDQITILNDGTIIVVAAERLAFSPEYRTPDGNLSYTAGIWTSTDGGSTWTDRSSVDGLGDDLYNQSMYNTSGNLLTTEAFSVTVDPNDPNQNTWFATDFYYGSQAYGTIYKTTNRGASWTVWEQMAQTNTQPYTIGQAEDLWIQPGGKVMLATTKNGLYYCPDYTAATPQFYAVQNFPFNGSQSLTIASDPYNSNKVYVTTMGNGIWSMDVSQLGAGAVGGIAQGVSATTMSSSEVMLNWTVTAPFGTSYTIQYSTSPTNWTSPGTVTVPNVMDNSYMVTGLTANTQYYFRMITVNAAGNSNPSAIATARTDGTPGTLGVEEVTQAVGNLNGTGSGTGWATTWSGNSAGDTVVAGNINNANPPTNTGNYIQITTSGVDASRTLSTSVGTAGSVVWIGFEISTATASSVLFGDMTNGFGWGTNTYSDYVSFITIQSGVVTYHQVNNSFTAGNHFLVGRLEFHTDGTVSTTLYIDPPPGITYPTNPVTSWQNSWNGVFTNTMLPSGTNKITLTHPTAGTAKYDELRIGGTYLDVAPLTVSAPTAPSTPTGTATGPNSINLTWTNNATNQQGFKIEQEVGGVWSTIERLYNTSTSGTVITYPITNLTASTGYNYRITAFNGNNQYSATTAASSTITTLPNPPAAVSVNPVSVSGSTFTVTWADLSNETGYTLQYADASGLLQPYNDGELPWTSVSLGQNTTTYTNSTLTANHLYYFRVYGTNSGGTGYCSNVVSGTSFPAPTVTATPNTNTQVLVTWNDVAIGESGYTVQYSTDNSSWTTGATTAANATQATITGLTADTIYYFRVQAFATGSTGVWSTSASTRTFATLSGQIAYDGFNYTAGSGANINEQGNSYGWTNNWTISNTSQATVLSGSLLPSGSTLNNTGNSLQLYQSTTATRTLNYTLGQDNTSLWVAFTVNNHVTGGTGSDYGNIQLGSDPNNYLALGSPWNGDYDGIAHIGGTTYYMQAGANPAAVVDGTTAFLVYRIDFATTGTPDQVRVWVNPTPGTQPSDASANSTWTLPAGVNFAFTNNDIKIVDSSYYNQATFDELRLGTTYGSVAPVSLPAAPSNLNASGTTSITLTWTDNSGTVETGFNVERSTNQTTWTHIGSTPTVGQNVTTFTDTTVAAGTTYYYRVSSENATGDSMPSNVYSITTAGTVPGAPTNLVANPGTSTVALTWTDNATATTTGYHIYRSTTNGTWGTPYATVVSATATSYTDSAPTPAGTAYYYAVTAYNGAGDSTITAGQNDINCSVATVTAYDSFNYTIGNGTNINGHNTGVGLSANWSINNTSLANVVAGLTYTSGTHTLTHANNAVQLNNYGAATGTMSTSIGTIGTSVWVGFIFEAYNSSTSSTINAAVDLNPSAGGGTGIQVGALTGNFNVRIDNGSYDGYLNTTTAVSANTPAFLVAKIDYLSTGDVITFYINPTPGVTPTTPAGTKTIPATVTLPVTGSVILYSPGTTFTTFDELRIGATYAAVAPDPITLLATPSPIALNSPASFEIAPISIDTKLTLTPLSDFTLRLVSDNNLPLQSPAHAILAGARLPDTDSNAGADSPTNPDALKDDLLSNFWLF